MATTCPACLSSIETQPCPHCGYPSLLRQRHVRLAGILALLAFLGIIGIAVYAHIISSGITRLPNDYREALDTQIDTIQPGHEYEITTSEKATYTPNGITNTWCVEINPPLPTGQHAFLIGRYLYDHAREEVTPVQDCAALKGQRS